MYTTLSSGLEYVLVVVTLSDELLVADTEDAMSHPGPESLRQRTTRLERLGGCGTRA